MQFERKPAQISVNEEKWNGPVIEPEPILTTGPLPDGYPFPPLTLTERRSEISSRVATLESGGEQTAVALDFGGRIVRFGPLTFGSEVEISATGPRGAEWHQGIEFVAGENRLLALAPVACETHRLDDGRVGVVMSGLAKDTLWSAGVTVSPVGPVVLDVSVSNRSYRSVPGDCGVLVHCAELACSGELAGVVSVGSGSLHFSWDQGEAGIEQRGPGVYIGRGLGWAPLHPRGSRTTKLRVYSCSIGGDVLGCSPQVVVAKSETGLQVWSPEGITGHIAIRSNGETFQAALDCQAGESKSLPVGEILSIDAVEVFDGGESVLAWSSGDALSNPPDDVSALVQRLVRAVEAVGDFQADVPGYEAAIEIKRASAKLTAGDQEAALGHLEKATATNGNDPLLWWFISALTRSEEAQDALLNAHYLSPAEPVLKVEAFLRMPVGEGGNMLAEIAADADAVMAIADTLLASGLYQDFARFADEILRHRNIPLLRYLLADQYLTRTKMEATAAEHVVAAGKAPVAPPFPWRAQECRSVLNLYERFPADGPLSTFARLAALSSSPP